MYIHFHPATCFLFLSVLLMSLHLLRFILRTITIEHPYLCNAGSSGSASHRQRPRRTGHSSPLQHPSGVQLCPQPHHQGNWRLPCFSISCTIQKHDTSQNWCVLAVQWPCLMCVFFATLSGVTASLVLQSALEPLPGFSSSLLTLYVPVVLRDGASGLTNTGTVTVTICPCLRGGMQTEDRGRQRDRRWERHMVCLPMPSASTSLIFSLVTLLAMLACVTTLLGRFGRFSWSLWITVNMLFVTFWKMLSGCVRLLLQRPRSAWSCVSSLPFSGVCTLAVIAPSETRLPLTLRGGWCQGEHHILRWRGGRGSRHRSFWHYSAAEHAQNTAHAQQQKHVSCSQK